MKGPRIELGLLVHFQRVFRFLGVPSLHTQPSCDTCDTFAPAAGHFDALTVTVTACRCGIQKNGNDTPRS